MIHPPAGLSVTLKTQILPAGVGGRVAGQAAGPCKEIGYGPGAGDGVVLPVAGTAVCDQGVGSFPDRPGLLVVEVLRVEHYEHGVFTLVLGVAHRTLLTLVTMVPALLGHALRDLLMAGQASGMRNFEILVVALHAVLEAHRLRMRGAERTGGIFLGVFLRCGPQGRQEDQKTKSHSNAVFFGVQCRHRSNRCPCSIQAGQ